MVADLFFEMAAPVFAHAEPVHRLLGVFQEVFQLLAVRAFTRNRGGTTEVGGFWRRLVCQGLQSLPALGKPE